MKYFLKEIIQNPVIGPENKAVNFERLADNFGIIAVEDSDPTARWLEDCSKRNILGVRAITEAQYEDYKKKLPYSPSESPPVNLQIRIMEAPNPMAMLKPQPPQTKEESEAQLKPRDPLKEHVQSAMAKVFAKLAAEQGNARSATEGDTLQSCNEQQPAKVPPPDILAEKARKSIGRVRGQK